MQAYWHFHRKKSCLLQISVGRMGRSQAKSAWIFRQKSRKNRYGWTAILLLQCMHCTRRNPDATFPFPPPDRRYKCPFPDGIF